MNPSQRCRKTRRGEDELHNVFKGIVEDAFRETPFNKRQDKAAPILSEARKHLSRKEFKELEKYVFKKLK